MIGVCLIRQCYSVTSKPPCRFGNPTAWPTTIPGRWPLSSCDRMACGMRWIPACVAHNNHSIGVRSQKAATFYTKGQDSEESISESCFVSRKKWVKMGAHAEDDAQAWLFVYLVLIFILVPPWRMDQCSDSQGLWQIYAKEVMLQEKTSTG